MVGSAPESVSLFLPFNRIVRNVRTSSKQVIQLLSLFQNQIFMEEKRLERYLIIEQQ